MMVMKKRRNGYLITWMNKVKAFIKKTNDTAWKVNFVSTIDELNQLRLKLKK